MEPDIFSHIRPAGDTPSGPPPGFTLLELVTVVTLLALALAELVPAARRQVDRMAVQGAREEVVGLFHRARMEAVARGGVTLTLNADSGWAELIHDDHLLARANLAREYHVSLVLSGEREQATLRYDALGLGRVASQTVRLSRGEALATLVVSSLGRVTRP